MCVAVMLSLSHDAAASAADVSCSWTSRTELRFLSAGHSRVATKQNMLLPVLPRSAIFSFDKKQLWESGLSDDVIEGTSVCSPNSVTGRCWFCPPTSSRSGKVLDKLRSTFWLQGVNRGLIVQLSVEFLGGFLGAKLFKRSRAWRDTLL